MVTEGIVRFILTPASDTCPRGDCCPGAEPQFPLVQTRGQWSILEVDGCSVLSLLHVEHSEASPALLLSDGFQKRSKQPCRQGSRAKGEAPYSSHLSASLVTAKREGVTATAHSPSPPWAGRVALTACTLSSWGSQEALLLTTKCILPSTYPLNQSITPHHDHPRTEQAAAATALFLFTCGLAVWVAWEQPSPQQLPSHVSAVSKGLVPMIFGPDTNPGKELLSPFYRAEKLRLSLDR